MKTLRNAVLSALACLVLASATVTARAGETNEVTFGTQWWTQSNNDAKYREFRDLPQGGILESFLLRQWSGRNQVTVSGVNGLAADQATRITLSNGVKYRLDFGYSETPHLFSTSARWGWNQISPGVFVLPDTLQARNQSFSNTFGPRMLDYLKAAPTIGLGFDTRVSNVRARMIPAKGWNLEARSSLRQRDGLKPYAMSFGFSTAVENPEPIDQSMLDVDLVADYRKNDFTFQASGGLSRFDNAITTLFVDNPRRVTNVSGGDGTAVGAMDLYPDNQVLRGSVAVGYMLPRRSSLTATLTLAHGQQDDPFLPITNNLALPQSSRDSLPAANLDGKTTQITSDIRLRTSPMDKLDGTLKFHFAEYRNESAELEFIGQAPYESSFQRYAPLHNHLLDFTQLQFGADADYEVAPNATIGGVAEYRVRERSPREVEKDHETVLGGRLRWLAPRDISVRADFTRGDRKMDEFLSEDYLGMKARPSTGVYDSLGQLEHPNLRRYDVADRKQDLGSLGISMPLGDRLDLDAGWSLTRNDYTDEAAADSMLGLDKEEVEYLTAGATLHVSAELDLHGEYGQGTTNTKQRSRESATASVSMNPLTTWTADIEDKESFTSLGFTWVPAKSRWTFNGDYEMARTVTSYDLANGANTAADVPNVLYRRQETTLEAGWRWLAHTSVVGRWGWQQFDMLDWSVNNVPLVFPVTGSATAIFLGDSSRSYTAHRVALVVKHRF